MIHKLHEIKEFHWHPTIKTEKCNFLQKHCIVNFEIPHKIWVDMFIAIPHFEWLWYHKYNLPFILVAQAWNEQENTSTKNKLQKNYQKNPTIYIQSSSLSLSMSAYFHHLLQMWGIFLSWL